MWEQEESRRQEGLNFVRHMLALPLSHSTKRSLPDRPVVYLVYTERHGVLYAGATKSLLRRWYDHHHFYFLDLAGCRIAWFPVEAASLHNVESRVIQMLAPPFNWLALKGADKWSKCVRIDDLTRRFKKSRNGKKKTAK